MDLFGSIKTKLDEWGESLRLRIMADVMRLIAGALQAKADDLEKE